MTLDIQSKGGGGVAQTVLHSFDIVAILERQNGKCVAKLVEAENEDILAELENAT